MATIISWDEAGKRNYNTGVDMVALFVKNGTTYGKPVAFNGVTAVNESPSGAESNKIYADNHEYLNLISKEEFACTLEAYAKPLEFDSCEGIKCGSKAGHEYIKYTQQPRSKFGLAYRTLIGNDTTAAEANIITDSSSVSNKNFIIHLVYECSAGVSSKDHATVNDSPEAATFSWEISTSKKVYTINNKNYELAHIEIDCSNLSDVKVTSLLNAIYGTGANAMPDPTTLYTILSA